MSNLKTSIKIKKLWVSDVAADGGIGVNWREIQGGAREATVQFNGSAADVSNYKNVLGANLESALSKGDVTLVFQNADLTPELIAELAGGTVTSDADADSYDAPINQNQSIEKSIKFLTEKNILFRVPRASLDAYPMMNDDDLHYYQVDSVVLLPEKEDVSPFGMDILSSVGAAKNDILTFSFGTIDSGAATIDTGAHTVAITITEASAVGITPTITVDAGASISPRGGLSGDYSSPVTHSVEAANGTKQNWVVTVTTTP